MSTKREFVQLAMQEGANRRELCHRFGISPKAGYALLKCCESEGEKAFAERSRRPLNSPGQTAQALQSAVLELHKLHPAWGARKICRCLQDLGHEQVPAPTTVTLRRHGLIALAPDDAHRDLQRLSTNYPTACGRRTFKGYFETAGGRRRPCWMTTRDPHWLPPLAARPMPPRSRRC